MWFDPLTSLGGHRRTETPGRTTDRLLKLFDRGRNAQLENRKGKTEVTPLTACCPIPPRAQKGQTSDKTQGRKDRRFEQKLAKLAKFRASLDRAPGNPTSFGSR
jgi:hypothetical protein